MEYWNIRPCTLYVTPPTEKEKKEVCRLPEASRLIHLGEVNGNFTRVLFKASREYEGWVYTDLLDEIVYQLPHDVVELEGQTPSKQDAEQYVKDAGRLEVNLCGEICVAMLMGLSLKEFLKAWKLKPNTSYFRIFSGEKARVTGIPDLKDMFAIRPDITTADLKGFFHSPPTDLLIVTPLRLMDTINAGWTFIVAIKIDYRGRIAPAGVGHWVTLTGCVAHGIEGGWVDYFNPFTNMFERGTWDQIKGALRYPSGLGVHL